MFGNNPKFDNENDNPFKYAFGGPFSTYCVNGIRLVPSLVVSWTLNYFKCWNGFALFPRLRVAHLMV